jgi:EAL domain-containing protein (putative c-di-GMP-specific phosphodiesterase class I)
MKNADMAMYQAKSSGRNNIRLFSAEIGERQVNRLGLERDLVQALAREQLSVHYQAKVDLSSRKIVGAEALLRWKHPQRGMVSPMEFIPLAEENGVIVPIGEWVLKTVSSQLVQWQSENIPTIPIAVNVSAKQFTSGDLVSVVKNCIGTENIGAGSIELELTESILMNDTKRAVDILGALRKIGVNVSLDDFGTGYSSLSYLKRFPLHTLKIDRSFVRDIESDADDASIVTAIIALSKSLGIKVIAEGVENERQARFLSQHGCHEAQGFLFSKPIPAQEFTALLIREPAFSVA